MLIEPGAPVGVGVRVADVNNRIKEQGAVQGEKTSVMMISNSNNNNSKWPLNAFDGLQTPGTF